ncbi:hypothetical protein [Lachnotalea sp. AF33-28]|uniref:hypothetical protein n=1 Tax=Lachnotalea sp. AF33-28 TaxID=2292046 RepID=UPI001FAAE544|nr:hypothetical protein [Lachnotalea sp. AF33-28]
MELTELLKEKEKILVGIGREWKNRTEGCAALLKLLEGKDFFIITSNDDGTVISSGLDREKITWPNAESGEYENWESYMNWIQGTLNRELLVLELGENYSNPALMRWPFEKTVYINQKAVLVRVNAKYAQIPEEIHGKAFSVPENSVDFIVAAAQLC